MAPNAKTAARQTRREKVAKVKMKIAKNTARVKRQKLRAEEAGLPPGSRLRVPAPEHKSSEQRKLEAKHKLNYRKAKALKAALRPRNSPGEGDLRSTATTEAKDETVNNRTQTDTKRKCPGTDDEDEPPAKKKARLGELVTFTESTPTAAAPSKKRKAPDGGHDHDETETKRLRPEATESEHENEFLRPPSGSESDGEAPGKGKKRNKKTRARLKRATGLTVVHNPREIKLRSSRTSKFHAQQSTESGMGGGMSGIGHGKSGKTKMPADISEPHQLWDFGGGDDE